MKLRYIGIGAPRRAHQGAGGTVQAKSLSFQRRHARSTRPPPRLFAQRACSPAADPRDLDVARDRHTAATDMTAITAKKHPRVAVEELDRRAAGAAGPGGRRRP